MSTRRAPVQRKTQAVPAVAGSLYGRPLSLKKTQTSTNAVPQFTSVGDEGLAAPISGSTVDQFVRVILDQSTSQYVIGTRNETHNWVIDALRSFPDYDSTIPTCAYYHFTHLPTTSNKIYPTILKDALSTNNITVMHQLHGYKNVTLLGIWVSGMPPVYVKTTYKQDFDYYFNVFKHMFGTEVKDDDVWVYHRYVTQSLITICPYIDLKYSTS